MPSSHKKDTEAGHFAPLWTCNPRTKNNNNLAAYGVLNSGRQDPQQMDLGISLIRMNRPLPPKSWTNQPMRSVGKDSLVM